MALLGNQAFLVVGQDFQGEYFAAGTTQTYTDEIQSFTIAYNGAVPASLAISNYQQDNDQVNFRRRDYNLGDIIEAGLQSGLEIYGGVFTPGAPSDPTGGGRLSAADRRERDRRHPAGTVPAVLQPIFRSAHRPLRCQHARDVHHLHGGDQPLRLQLRNRGVDGKPRLALG